MIYQLNKESLNINKLLIVSNIFFFKLIKFHIKKNNFIEKFLYPRNLSPFLLIDNTCISINSAIFHIINGYFHFPSIFDRYIIFRFLFKHQLLAICAVHIQITGTNVLYISYLKNAWR